jgi:hypothetical protein
VPYIEHPLRNALRLIRWGAVGHPVVIASALLHDVVEDCAHEIVSTYAVRRGLGVGLEADDHQGAHEVALEWLGMAYIERLSRSVSLVSNKPGATREDYLPHIEQLAQTTPAHCVISSPPATTRMPCSSSPLSTSP